MSRTLVLLKPDAVERGLMGRIISRFEDTGLKIRDMKMFSPPKRCLILKHYESTDQWLLNVGKKTLEDYYAVNLTEIEVKRDYGVSDEMSIGRIVKERLVSYLSSGTVVAIIIEGNMAVEKIRNLIGSTMPAQAAPGTIRGDYGSDSAANAAFIGRSIENLTHGSDSELSAENEINLWFGNGC
ncbi:nucleoside-diphosphate kinase [bacterium]|nr:nucleoside-diphosphate kinase [bacterium]